MVIALGSDTAYVSDWNINLNIYYLSTQYVKTQYSTEYEYKKRGSASR
jgi:hypothetical protein